MEKSFNFILLIVINVMLVSCLKTTEPPVESSKSSSSSSTTTSAKATPTASSASATPTASSSSSGSTSSSSPSIAGIFVTNNSVTNSTVLSLQFGSISGSPTEYCLQENKISNKNCVWDDLPIPTSFTVSSTNGSKVLSLWVRDSSGSTSGRTDSQTITLDTVAPNGPYNGSTNPTTGSSAQSIFVKGSASSDTVSVDIYDNLGCTNLLGSGTKDLFQAGGIAVYVQASTTTTFYAKTYDQAGNASTCTSLASYLQVPASSSSGGSSATLGFVSITPQSLNSSSSPVVIGWASTGVTTVNLYLDSACATLITSTTKSQFSGSGVSVPVATNATNLIFGKATDSSGSSSCTFLTTYVHDSTNPTWSTTISHASTYSSLTTSPSFTYTANGSDVNSIQSYEYAIGTANTGGAAASQYNIKAWTAITNTTYQATSLTLVQGTTYYVNMRAKDYAGNYSTVLSSSGWIADTSGPATAPVIVSSNPASPSNASTAPLIIGTSTADTATVYIYKDSSCLLQVGSGTKAEFEGTGVLVSLSSNASSTLYTKAADSAGNLSSCSTSTLTYLHDDIAPIVASLAVSNSSPTNSTTYTLVWGSLIGSPTQYCILQNDTNSANCAWTNVALPSTYIVTGADGAKVLSAWVRDATLNVSSRVDSNSVTLDTVIPNQASAAVTVPTVSGETTNPLIKGTLDSTAATIELYSNAGCTSPLGSGTKDLFTGLGVMLTVSSGALNSIYAKTLDSAGNTSACHFLVNYTHVVSTTTPEINLSTSALTVDEGKGTISVPVVLTLTRSSSTTISYTVGGTASNPADHNLSSGSVTIPAFSNTAYISFTLYDDPLTESTETVTITLGSPPIGVNLGSISSYTLTIKDNEITAASSLMNQVTSIASAQHTCAVIGGALACWGRNDYSQATGDGTTVARTAPFYISDLQSGVTKVAVGLYNTCVIHNGAAKCWGQGGNGIIGDGSSADKTVPTQVSGLTSGVTDIDIDGYGAGTACAIQNGAAKCWGYNAQGQIGDGTTTTRSTPVQVSGLDSDVTMIAITSAHDTATHYATTCAIHKGAAKCWGYNGYGQIGDGTTTTRNSPTQVSGLTSGVTHITVGSGYPVHACAVHKGAAKCWGHNDSGKLGDGTSTQRTTPVSVTGMSNDIERIEAYDYYTCATKKGEMRCWGDNTSGALGDTTTTGSVNPIQVYGLSDNVELISRGSFYAGDGTRNKTTCATRYGILYCWGKNNYGQVGDGSVIDRSSPQKVPGINYNSTSTITKVAAGRNHACAIQDGALKCWGYNNWGQLGNCTTNQRSSYTQVTGLDSGVTDVVMGYLTTCAIHNGAVKCFGHNGQGQMGIGTIGSDYSCPQSAVGLTSGVTNIYFKENGQYDYGYVCAIQNGSAKCWGANDQGQLGFGSNSPTTVGTPAQVTGLSSGVTHMSLSGDSNSGSYTCAIKDGAAYCWGYDGYGQLGDGTAGGTTYAPVQPTGLASGVTDIRTGGQYGQTCAIVSGGLKCWGRNGNGQLGVGNTTNYAVPQPVTNMGSSGSGVTKVSVSGRGDYGYTCAVQNGTAYCWGYNGTGQLGDGTTTQSLVPVAVSGLPSTVSDITTSDGQYGHTCSLHTDGAVRCWGRNNYGQIGDGTTTNPRLTYNTVFSSGSTSVVFGEGTTSDDNFSLILRNGLMYSFGYNGSGQLGDGTATSRSTPSAISFYKEPSTILAGVTKITTGKNHSCAIIDGAAKCWGKNTYGQLGNASNTSSSTYVSVSGLTDQVSEIEAGSDFTCALRLGIPSCWGLNSSGQLGNNSTTASNIPVSLNTLTSNTTAISTGDTHACAIQGNKPYCWGDNSYGKLGNASTTQSLVPVAVSDSSDNATSISAGDGHTCYIKGGAGYCFGYNGDGRLGNGSVVNAATPVAMTILTEKVSQISAGKDHTCGIQNAAAYCAGNNTYGQLGDATTTSRYDPTLVSGMSSSVTKISAGATHTCAVKSSQIRCWGDNDSYQLGIGTGGDEYSPQLITTMSDILDVSSGVGHTCAYNRTSMYCHGTNTNGQLGDGTNTDSSVPIRIYP